jgi:hypothetical protein
MVSGYQTQVYNQEAQGVAGDRASLNAIMTFDAGPGGLVADVGGVTVGNFAWVVPPTDPNGTSSVATQSSKAFLNTGANVAGLVYNVTQGLNTVFLSDAGMVIPQGLPVALAVQGDFWVVNGGSAIATVGQKAYAILDTGAVQFAATGTATAVSTATGSSVAASTFSVTGSINGDLLTVTAVSSGTIVAGATISGTGISGSPQIGSQVSGTAGGIGVYALTVSQQKSVASTTVSGTYGTMTVGTMTVGTQFSVGQLLIASGSVVAGTMITQLLTGTGNAGSTFAVNNNTPVSSQSISAVGAVETKWVAASVAQPGGLVKITSWVGSQG